MRFAPSLILAGLLGSGSAFFACTTDNGLVAAPPLLDAGTPDVPFIDAGTPDGESPAGPVTADVQILDLSSLRGQLDPIAEVDANGDTQTYGGLEALAGYFAKDRKETPATIVLTGGDVVGATSALSSLNDDAPTVSGLNLLGTVAATFGPHDFERGDAFLATKLQGSVFRWVSTNIPQVNAALGPRPITPFVLVDVGQTRVKIAVLGVSAPDLATLVPPAALGTATVDDPVATTNAAAAAARAAGAHIVVSLAHFGATGTAFGAPAGPLVDYAKQVKGVDVVFGGQTDQLVSTTVQGGPHGTTLILQNRDRGRTYAKVKLHVEAGVLTAVTPSTVEPVAVASAHLTDPTGGCGGSKPPCRCQGSVAPAVDVSCPTGFACDASGHCTQVAMAPDPAATALLAPYRNGLSAALDGRLGKIAIVFARDGAAERTAEAAIGDFVADAMLDQYAAAGVRVALVNAGTLTSGLPSSYAAADKTLHRPDNGAVSPFDLVAGDAFFTVPPTTACVVRPLSGQTLWSVLETSVGALPLPQTGFLQVSGLHFTYKASSPKGARIQSVTLADGHDVPKDDTTLYSVVMTSATSRGDDGYTMLVETLPTPGRRLVADVLRDYIPRVSAGAPDGLVVPPSGRITQIP
jgi:5'-nucleotidase